MTYDYIVVGSGPSGAQAAQTLVESGVKVLMLDAGYKDDYYKNLIPAKDFVTIRQTDENQHEYFLGKFFEGIPWGKIKVGSQLTPPRKFITEQVSKFLKVDSDTFFPMESLAKGGLGSGWGTGCHVFSEMDLTAIGLNSRKIFEAYNIVAKRIGISGEKDDANPFGLGNIEDFQSALELENGSKKILNKYLSKKKILNDSGFYLGKLALAVLSENKDDRKKASFDDMNFWSDAGKSAYRPWITIEQLVKKSNFAYKDKCLVISFKENESQTEVTVLKTDTNEKEIFSCKKLILACGTLGTARIVLRSSEKKETKLPIISNPYCYMPCLQTAMLGTSNLERKSGFGQLGLFYDPNKNQFDTGMGAMFSYRSLLLFKLVKESPLNFSDGRIIMQYLQSSFVITGIHHPERPSENKFIGLQNDVNSKTGDKLIAKYVLSEAEQNTNDEREKKYKWALRKLGCYPLKSIYPGHGSSIHYAGTLPFSDDKSKPFSISPEGKLNGTKNIFIADGSGFRYLPAKGLTLTLMANAHCVAENSLKIND